MLCAVSTVYTVSTDDEEIGEDELAAHWLRQIIERARELRGLRDMVALTELEFDRELLVAARYIGISELAVSCGVSRPTIYKAIERARRRIENTVDGPHDAN